MLREGVVVPVHMVVVHAASPTPQPPKRMAFSWQQEIVCPERGPGLVPFSLGENHATSPERTDGIDELRRCMLGFSGAMVASRAEAARYREAHGGARNCAAESAPTE